MQSILCFGDSITFGVGELPTKGWVGRLKEAFEHDTYNFVYNLGIPGDTSAGLIKRVEAECARVRYKRKEDAFLIIVSIGMNDVPVIDGEPRVHDEVFEENITKLILAAQKTNANILFTGIPPVDESRSVPTEGREYTNARINVFNEIISSLCHEYHVHYLNIGEGMDASMIADDVHPNTKGYDLMYTTLKECLNTSGLLEIFDSSILE